ncbi:hypothetical protein LguiA_018555 [Lonicera macranthoides]
MWKIKNSMIAQRKFDKDHSINIRSSQRSIRLKPIYPNQDHSSTSVGQDKKINLITHKPAMQIHEAQRSRIICKSFKGKASSEESI